MVLFFCCLSKLYKNRIKLLQNKSNLNQKNVVQIFTKKKKNIHSVDISTAKKRNRKRNPGAGGGDEVEALQSVEV